jgi:hypothetical protein
MQSNDTYWHRVGTVVQLEDPTYTLLLPTSEMATVTDPALNAAVTTAIIDDHSGVIIVLTAAGNAQTLQSPTILTGGKEFVVANSSTSTHNIDVDGYTLEPGEAQSFTWDGSAWCSLEAFESATRTTQLDITGEIAAGTNFSVTASGVSYTKTGDDGNLRGSAALFKAAEYIVVFLNGVYQIKGVQATWQSQTSFQLNIIVDSGDEIIILS